MPLLRNGWALTWPGSSTPNTVAVSGTAGVQPGLHVEAAGRAFHHKALAARGLAPLEAEDDVEEELHLPDEYEEVSFGEGGTDDLDAWEKRCRRKGFKFNGEKGWQDWYAMLDLQEVRWKASVAEIKDAYKRVAMRLHPDKCGIGSATQAQRDRIEARYKLIQDAFETLTDVTKRRLVDSTDVPDKALPETLAAGADFYEVFGPAFEGLARYSERPGAPLLGDASTPYAEVDAMYSFWYTFKSWREFPHEDEEDSEVADSRERKRDIERKNAKLREAAKKEETNKIKDFVQAAYKFDPRVIAAAAAAKAKKEAKKLERGAGRRAEEEAAAKAAAEAAEAAAAAAAAEGKAREEGKAAKEKARKALQASRKKLRTAAEGAVAAEKVTPALVEELCAELPVEGLTALAAALEGAALDAQVAALSAALAKLRA